MRAPCGPGSRFAHVRQCGRAENDLAAPLCQDAARPPATNECDHRPLSSWWLHRVDAPRREVETLFNRLSLPPFGIGHRYVGHHILRVLNRNAKPRASPRPSNLNSMLPLAATQIKLS